LTSRPPRELAAINPRSYLDLAVELAGRPESHLVLTAGDRAYYAAFLSSRNLLAEKGYAPFYEGVTAHANVTQALRTHLSDGIGNEENRLRRARNQLTYNTGAVPMSRGRSIQWMIRTAREIIDAVSDLPERA
jgi:uncharacterized protein (UPF0332 family)